MTFLRKEFLMIILLGGVCLNACNIVLVPVDVSEAYVAGFECDQDGTPVATVWVGEEATALTDGIHSAYAYSVFVTGEDVYAAGFAYVDSGNTVAKVWKNGEELPWSFGAGGSKAYAVFVLGQDVMVVGYAYDGSCNRATLWVNGIEKALSDGPHNACAQAVYVDGPNRYVVGYEENDSGIMVAKMWVYDQEAVQEVVDEVVLSNGTLDAWANSVVVYGTTVYVAGNERNEQGKSVALLWNTAQSPALIEVTALSDGTQDAHANAVFCTGSDVYVAGFDTDAASGNTVATLWINAEPTALTDGRQMAEAEAVFVLGDDCYVAGYETDVKAGNNYAKLWKNGRSVVLSERSAHALSVVAVQTFTPAT